MTTATSPAVLRVFTDPRCLEHRPPAGYPECPERLEGILERLRSDGFEIVETGAHAASAEAIRRVHDPAYVERFRRAVERGDGLLDSADNPLTPTTWDAANGAVDAALAACDWVVEGARRRAFVAVRPPGHHAEHDRAMGFCFFDTVAVAADQLLQRDDVERVAIFDFDVHHGNGTQHLFEERVDVLFVSSHQFPFYPGTGAAAERGVGPGEGATLNIPLPAGSGDSDYQSAFHQTIYPALRAARPDVLLISAGFDAYAGDPLGGMAVSVEAFETWGRELAGLADEICGGRLVSFLEGGYALGDLGALVSAYLSGTA